MKLKLICLDLHGVLLDATQGFANVLTDGKCIYDDPKNLGDYAAISRQEGFVKLLNEADASFWSGLDILPHAEELIAVSKSIAESVVIVSHSCSGACYTGSAEVAKGFGLDFISTPHKHHLARKKVLLIDDYDVNIDNFLEAGGEAMTFPQKWNSYSSFTDFRFFKAALTTLGKG